MRDVDDAVVTLAVGPVGEAAARELARRVDGARAFLLGVHPDHLAGLAVERDHRAARAAGRVDDALDHQRRAFELELGTRAEVVGLEAPGDFELVEVAAVDLIERGVARALDVGGVVRPLAVLGARESRGLSRELGRQARPGGHQPRHAGDGGCRQHGAFQCSCHSVCPFSIESVGRVLLTRLPGGSEGPALPLPDAGVSCRVRQGERDVLARVDAAAHRDDDVLLAVGHVGHRRTALRGRHPDGADLGAVVLVVGAQHRAARTSRRRRHLRIAEHDERLGDHQADAAVLAGLRDVHPLQRRIGAHVVRRVAVRHLELQLALVEIDRRERRRTAA